MKIKYHFFILFLILSACCESSLSPYDAALCVNQIFTETKKINLKFDYTVNTTTKFFLAQTITADKIRKALGVPENENFTLKSIDITSGKINYGRNEDNEAGAMNVNFAIVGNTFNQILLLKKDLLLPLYDIPEIPLVSPAIKINEFFDAEGLKGLKDILRDYVIFVDNDGISFILLGQSTPVGLGFLTHFTLNFNMYVTVVYEVCRLVPMGEGERPCD